LAEIGRDEAHVRRDRNATLLEPALLHRLARRMVDLEDRDVASKGRLSDDEAVEPGADEDVLTSAAPDGRLERIFSISGSNDHTAVRGMGPQGRVDRGLLGTEALEPLPRLRVGAVQYAPVERRLLRGGHQ